MNKKILKTEILFLVVLFLIYFSFLFKNYLFSWRKRQRLEFIVRETNFACFRESKPRMDNFRD